MLTSFSPRTLGELEPRTWHWVSDAQGVVWPLHRENKDLLTECVNAQGGGLSLAPLLQQ